MALPSVQSLVATAQPGTTLRISAGDYGPLVIDKPLAVEGAGACFWGDGTDPALTIRSKDVVLRELVLRYAASRANRAAPPTVLAVAAGDGPKFQNVRIQGSVSGLPGESEPWWLPDSLNLGELNTPKALFTLEIAVPVNCRLTTRISGLDFDLPALVPGICQVRLRVRDLTPDSVIVGYVEVVSQQLVRLMPLIGHVTAFSKTPALVVTCLARIPPEQRAQFVRSTALKAANQIQKGAKHAP
jgi:hypothetical protein